MRDAPSPSTSLAVGLNALRRNVTGDLVLPEDEAYDLARGVWNAVAPTGLAARTTNAHEDVPEAVPVEPPP